MQQPPFHKQIVLALKNILTVPGTLYFIDSFILTVILFVNILFVIFLHGSGERGKNNEAQLKWGVANFATDQTMKLHPAFVIAPQCPENISWSNFSRSKNNTELLLQPSPSKPMELLISLILQAYKDLTNR